MDIKFLRDDAAKEREEAFKEVLGYVKRDVKKERDIAVGKRFLFALFLAGRNLKWKAREENVVRGFEEVREVIPKVLLRVPEQQVKREAPKEASERPRLILEKEKKDYSRKYILLTSVLDSVTLATASLEQTNGGYRYLLTEPEVNTKVLDKTKGKISKKYEKNAKILKDDKYLIGVVKKICKQLKADFSENQFNNIKYYLYRDLLNFGRIDPLLYDKNIILIHCQGSDALVIVDYREIGRIETNIVLSNQEINDLIRKFADRTGNQISKEKPEMSGIFHNLRIDAKSSETSSAFTIRKISP